MYANLLAVMLQVISMFFYKRGYKRTHLALNFVSVVISIYYLSILLGA